MGKILVLGGTGMLGSQVIRALKESSHDVIETARKHSDIATRIEFVAGQSKLSELTSVIDNLDYVINCIGVIKPYISDNNSHQIENAIKINALFPHELMHDSLNKGYKVIQIATDCVYSGRVGNYSESDEFDALDVYGKSKSLGEVKSDKFMNLRCSIIGPEMGRSTSLWEWVVNQESKAQINGFINHNWNGLTTYAFGRICSGIISNDHFIAGTSHLVPADKVNKYELLNLIASKSLRTDLRIKKIEAPISVDRTLRTNLPNVNEKLWKCAGYNQVPSISELIGEI